MKQIYNFEQHTPPVLNESMIRSEIERRKLQCQTTLLVLAGILIQIVVSLFGYSVVKLISNHNDGAVVVEDEGVALDILVGIDSAPYLDWEHDIYPKHDGSGGYDFKDGFDIIIEYQVHDDSVLHGDMLHCLVLEQDGGYYIIDDRPNDGRFIREIDEEFYNELASLFN